jgi:hypothetical protein
MILAVLRFHVEAILQVFKVLSFSFCLVVQLTALSVLIFVGHVSGLNSMATLVAVDTLIFNSDARPGS